MQTMQACIPFNLACLAIATLYYMWRDVYIPRHRNSEQFRERVSRLLWAAAAAHNNDSEVRPVSNDTNTPAKRQFFEDLDDEEEEECRLALYREVECRACNGKHTFHYSGKPRPAGSTYEFTCPVVKNSTWIWWLGKPEPVEELPADVVVLTWVAV
jgi:hypothetical protein